MYIGDTIFCKGCDIKIYEGEEKIVDSDGIYHRFCHRKKRRDELLRELLKERAQGLGLRVLPRRQLR